MSKTTLSVSILVSVLGLGFSLSACAPSDPVAEARALVKSGNYEASLTALRDLLAERPDDPELNYLYGVTVSSQGQPTMASWSLRKAMEHEEWRVRAGMEIAYGALQTQQHDAALEVMEEVLAVEPDNIEALLLRSRAYFESRAHYEQSLADAERVLELEPDSREAMVWKAVNLMYLERIDEAEELIDQIEQRYAEADAPLQQTLFFCAGQAGFAAAKGDKELADQRYRECLALDPTHRIVIEEAVGFYEAQDDTDRIIEIYRAAHEIDPVNGGFRSVLATTLRGAGQADEAEALLLEGTELDSVGAAVNSWIDLAALYSTRDDYAAAASAVKSAIDRIEAAGQPVAPLLAFNYADMLLLAERYAEADAVAQTIALPQFRSYIQARVLLEQGDPQAALDEFQTVLANWPNNAPSRFYAAIASEELGDFEGAIEGYRYAIRAGPSQTNARMRLGRLHAARGDYERANMALAVGGGPRGADPELHIEGMRVVGKLGSGEEIRRRLAGVRGKPVAAPAAVAVAEGVYERAGPQQALALLEPADTTQPANALILRAVVLYLGELGRHDEALRRTAAALTAHPAFGPFHEARARALAGAGRPAAQAAYERADELMPDNARVLEGLGELAAASGDADAALALYAQAAAADEEWALPDRKSAELLLGLGRDAEAEARLDAVIERDPYDPWAPARLAELLLARGGDPARSIALAQRAVYFGGGEEADAILVRASGQARAAAVEP